MKKIPQRKQRKHTKRSKDRRSLNRRRKDKRIDNQYGREMIMEIVKMLPKKDMTYVNQKFFCVSCSMYYCVNFHGDSEYCRECHLNNCCLKTTNGKKKLCDFCEREGGNERTIH